MAIIALWAICGAICAVIAQYKSRDVFLWAVIGALTGILGVIAVSCLPSISRPDAG